MDSVMTAAAGDPIPVLIRTGPADPRLWVRVARMVLDDIQAGKLRPAEHLPAVPAMAAGYGVSPATVSRALRELAGVGILSRNGNHGPFRVTGSAPGIAAGTTVGTGPAPAPPQPVPASKAACSPAPPSDRPRPGQAGSAGGSEAPRFLTVGQCAAQARLANMTIYRLLDEGTVESTRIGRSRRIYADSWTAYLNRGRTDPGRR